MIIEYDRVEEFATRKSSSRRTRRVISAALRRVYPNPGEPIFDPSVADRMADVADWIVHAHRAGAGWVRDLDRDGIPRIVSSASGLDELWATVKRDMKACGGEFSPPYAEGDEIEAFAFADGWRAVRLTTREAVARECRALRACPRTEGVFRDGDLEAGRQGFVCIRDQDGNTVLMMGLNRLAICDVVAFRGCPPERSLIRDYVMEYLEAHGLSPMHVDSIPGMVLAADGLIHDLHELPDGVVIEGDLRINDKCPDLRRLPDDMTVRGTFVIWGNQFLTEVPRNFHAADGMAFTDCRNLRVIRSGVSSPVWSSFAGSRNLRTIEDGCHFPDGVELPGNEAMKSAFPLYQGRSECISVTMTAARGRDTSVLTAFAGKVARAASAVVGSRGVVKRVSGNQCLGSVLREHRSEREAMLLAAQGKMDAEMARRASRPAAGPRA